VASHDSLMISKLSTFLEVYREHGLDSALISSAHYVDADRLHYWLLNRFWGFDPDSNYKIKIINADVDRISHTQWFPFKVRGDRAIVGELGGNWDMMTKEFAQRPLYRSLEMRFTEGEPWEKTPMYQETEVAIKNGGQKWNSCESMSDLQKRCDKIDNLYRDMRENGYKNQLNNCWNRSVQGVSLPDEIRIAVGRDGRFIRCASGRHRLIIAKLLDIDTITATIQIEHKGWDGDFDIIKSISL